MQFVVVIVGILLAVVGLLKVTGRQDFSGDYEIDFVERHKDDFISRFDTDLFDLR